MAQPEHEGNPVVDIDSVAVPMATIRVFSNDGSRVVSPSVPHAPGAFPAHHMMPPSRDHTSSPAERSTVSHLSVGHQPAAANPGSRPTTRAPGATPPPRNLAPPANRPTTTGGVLAPSNPQDPELVDTLIGRALQLHADLVRLKQSQHGGRSATPPSAVSPLDRYTATTTASSAAAAGATAPRSASHPFSNFHHPGHGGSVLPPVHVLDASGAAPSAEDASSRSFFFTGAHQVLPPSHHNPLAGGRPQLTALDSSVLRRAMGVSSTILHPFERSHHTAGGAAPAGALLQPLQPPSVSGLAALRRTTVDLVRARVHSLSLGDTDSVVLHGKQRRPSSDSDSNPGSPSADLAPVGAMASATTPTSGMPSSRQTAPRRPLLESLGLIQALDDSSFLAMAIDVVYVLASVVACMVGVLGINARFVDPQHGPASRVPMALAQAVTLLWVIQRFFVRNRAAATFQVNDTVKKTSLSYLRTWFPFDLCYAVPIEFIFVDSDYGGVARGGTVDIFHLLALRHLLRFVRIFSLSRASNPIVLERAVFWFLGSIAGSVVVIGIAAVCFTFFESQVSLLEAGYWALATALTIGYGDITPVTTNGRVVAMATMVVGLAIVSTTTAIVTATLTRRDRLQQDLDDRKRLMSSMLDYYEVPWRVQKDVIKSFPTVLDAHSNRAFQEMLVALPQACRVQVEGYTRLRLLRKVALFDVVDQEHALVIAQCLTQRFVAAGDPVVLMGDEGHEMFFLISGVVDVIIENKENGEPIILATLHDGSYFGELALLQDPTKATRMAHVFAVTLTELLVLTRTDFDRVVRAIPKMMEAFRREVFKRAEIKTTVLERVNSSHYPRTAGTTTTVTTHGGGALGSRVPSAMDHHPIEQAQAGALTSLDFRTISPPTFDAPGITKTTSQILAPTGALLPQHTPSSSQQGVARGGGGVAAAAHLLLRPVGIPLVASSGGSSTFVSLGDLDSPRRGTSSPAPHMQFTTTDGSAAGAHSGSEGQLEPRRGAIGAAPPTPFETRLDSSMEQQQAHPPPLPVNTTALPLPSSHEEHGRRDRRTFMEGSESYAPAATVACHMVTDEPGGNDSLRSHQPSCPAGTSSGAAAHPLCPPGQRAF